MGIRRRKNRRWTSEEERALLAGVRNREMEQHPHRSTIRSLIYCLVNRTNLHLKTGNNGYRNKEALPNNHENCNDMQNAPPITETFSSYAANAIKVVVAGSLSQDAEEAREEVERLEKISEESMAMPQING